MTLVWSFHFVLWVLRKSKSRDLKWTVSNFYSFLVSVFDHFQFSVGLSEDQGPIIHSLPNQLSSIIDSLFLCFSKPIASFTNEPRLCASVMLKGSIKFSPTVLVDGILSHLAVSYFEIYLALYFPDSSTASQVDIVFISLTVLSSIVCSVRVYCRTFFDDCNFIKTKTGLIFFIT